MSNVVLFQPLQLKSLFEAKFIDGGKVCKIFQFGAFPSELALKKWKECFIEAFQCIFEEESEILECPGFYNPPEPYDSKGGAIRPAKPEDAAQKIINELLSCDKRDYPEDDGPFLWELTLWLRVKGISYPFSLVVVAGPFDEKIDVFEWATLFLAAVTKELSDFPMIEKMDESEEAIIEEKKYKFSEDKSEFLTDSSGAPEEAAMRFITETKRSLLICI